jgi:hypothetical protein
MHRHGFPIQPLHHQAQSNTPATSSSEAHKMPQCTITRSGVMKTAMTLLVMQTVMLLLIMLMMIVML